MDGGERVAGGEAFAVLDAHGDLDAGVYLVKGGGEYLRTAEYAVFAGTQHGCRRFIGGDGRRGGDVPGRRVLHQRAADRVFNDQTSEHNWFSNLAYECNCVARVVACRNTMSESGCNEAITFTHGVRAWLCRNQADIRVVPDISRG